MKRFSARNFKGDFTRAYDIPHSLLCRRSRGGPKDVLALLSVEEPEKGLLPNVFPAERGSVANLIGFVGALVESVAASCYFWAQYQSLNRTICSRFFGFGHHCHRCNRKVGIFIPGLERPVRLCEGG